MMFHGFNGLTVNEVSSGNLGGEGESERSTFTDVETQLPC